MTASALTEKKILQIAVVLACLIPLSAGLSGMLQGVQLLGEGDYNLDSHVRYLSGLLLGIGLAFLSGVHHIEQQSEKFRLLTLIVVTGGIGRLLGVLLTGMPGGIMQLALGMELVVTPALCLWQHRLARRFNN